MLYKEYTIKHIIVGSGAAGFSAALRLHALGERDLALVTEGVRFGTSRNTGSDKQTYYKLSLASEDRDSVRAMAEDLFAGGCVDGDQALCEAALSSRGFFYLTELGVPFPCTEYGEFMGYKTDHDRGRRATSAGPYTSRMMTECLERRAGEVGLRVLDKLQVIKILVRDNSVAGILCLNREADSEQNPYVLIRCKNLVMATGGPAGMYHDSVYPASQLGSTGLMLEAGAHGKNLTEWQYGMASRNPRWNVSGTYMQVLPRFVSTEEDGSDPREFLSEFFTDRADMLNRIFLKGYQWPFDVSKIDGGSSLIDLLIYRESVMRGRRVWLDFTKNPDNEPIDFASLSEEARDYLTRAGAACGTPIERLTIMNQPAIDFYGDHGVDLTHDMLEIAICAQHNNGGIETDKSWESAVKGLFVIGEASGTHGVTRPGGTALNAGQVGAIRAAECIHIRELDHPDGWTDAEEPGKRSFDSSAEMSDGGAELSDVSARLSNSGADLEMVGVDEGMHFLRTEADTFLNGLGLVFPAAVQSDDSSDSAPSSDSSRHTASACGHRPSPADLWQEMSAEMSACAGMLRNREALAAMLKRLQALNADFSGSCAAPDGQELPLYFHLRDMLLSQEAYVSAMLNYIDRGAGSRGSALYTDPEGFLADTSLPESFRFSLDGGSHSGVVQTALVTDGSFDFVWRPVRPIPEVDYFFENQWRAYRSRYHL